jgi:hypothetical protein
MTSTSYPIPKPLWDAIENVLLAKSNELIKDIAKSLHQPPRPLLDAFKAKKHTFHLLETPDPTQTECQALVQDHAVAHRCRKPVLLGQTVCPDHEFWKMPAISQKPVLRRLKTSEGETYFVDSLQNVYTVDFERIGQLQEDNTIVFFEVEES